MALSRVNVFWPNMAEIEENTLLLQIKGSFSGNENTD